MSDGETPPGSNDLEDADAPGTDGAGEPPHPWEAAIRGDGNLLLRHAAYGALVTVGLVFLVVSPLVGGALAGWTHRKEGVRVGALSGGLAMVPIGVVMLFLFVMFAGPGIVVSESGVLGGLAAFVALAAPRIVAVAAVVVALSTLGGAVGARLARPRAPIEPPDSVDGE